MPNNIDNLSEALLKYHNEVDNLMSEPTSKFVDQINESYLVKKLNEFINFEIHAESDDIVLTQDHQITNYGKHGRAKLLRWLTDEFNKVLPKIKNLEFYEVLRETCANSYNLKYLHLENGNIRYGDMVIDPGEYSSYATLEIDATAIYAANTKAKGYGSYVTNPEALKPQIVTEVIHISDGYNNPGRLLRDLDNLRKKYEYARTFEMRYKNTVSYFEK